MALQVQGNSGTVLEVETNTRALRITPRPTDVGALGSYAIGQTTGTIAAGAAANAPIFSFRWGDSSGKVALVRKVYVSISSLATGFTAGVGSVGIICARTFTASDSGQTAVTLTGNNMKRRTSFGTTLATDIRISNTGAITAGTRTLDSADLARYDFTVDTTVQKTFFSGPLWAPDFSGEWPLVLAQNEGFVVRSTMPATGTWSATISAEWSEVTSY